MKSLRQGNVHNRPPQADLTPADFTQSRVDKVERIKRPLRRCVYPTYRLVCKLWLRHRYQYTFPFPVDQWLWGQRGNDLESHRRRIDRMFGLRGRDVLIAGCGTGRDVASWLAYPLKSLTGVDYFNYERAWRALREEFGSRCFGTTIDFIQGDLVDLQIFRDESFDLMGSDAVFEHVTDLGAVLKEAYRVLRPGGLLYATYGPLWYCWGGDHLSGYDDLSNGYNHLLLDRPAYDCYLECAGKYVHSEHDGRTWIRHGLFSYLRPTQYIELLRGNGFSQKYIALSVEPRAVRCLRENRSVLDRLFETGCSEFDLIITGMTVIFQKPGGPI